MGKRVAAKLPVDARRGVEHAKHTPMTATLLRMFEIDGYLKQTAQAKGELRPDVEAPEK